jgi:hypothetical protein
MGKIALRETHFMFLRTLVDEFLEVGGNEDEEVLQEVLDIAEEVKELLEYTKWFKHFTILVEVADGEEDGDSES